MPLWKRKIGCKMQILPKCLTKDEGPPIVINHKKGRILANSDNCHSPLKGQTDGKINFDGWIIPLGDTCYVVRISKYIMLMKKIQ